MLKIGLIISIGVILLIAWIITSRTRAPKPEKEKFKEIPSAPPITKLSRHDTVSGKRFSRKHTPPPSGKEESQTGSLLDAEVQLFPSGIVPAYQ